MKRNSLIFIAAIICAAVLVSSCGTLINNKDRNISVDFGHRGNQFGQQIITPAKDFNGLGLVFSEQSFELNTKERFDGQTFTYQALLREAKALNADAIINVVIDYRVVIDSTIDDADKRTEIKTETWYGSALAIKYTTSLSEKSTATSNQQDWIVTNTTTTESPILNGGSSGSGSSGGGLFGGGSSGGSSSSSSSGSGSGGRGLFGSLGGR